ncbi:uncharacterized protein ARMOST_21075 [Armillaria ostoyae]|uniref:Uncharacterized protein n=1 Tax=Armillaria ostoyae TaxID=47428 RepID=A0A284S939_ARMOS|nr:uncharacterized protein ARMOST_21075 [Armillaria ostoyae]
MACALLSWPFTYVSFCRQSADLSQRHSTSEFLDFLEGCPLLEDLILFDAGPMRWSSSDVRELRNDRIVHLANLRTFQWGYFKPAAVPHITQLISHLILSQTVVHLLGVEYWSPDDNCDISNLVSAFAAGVTKVTEWRFSFTKTNDNRHSEYVFALVDGLLYTSGITYSPQGHPNIMHRYEHPTAASLETLFRCLPSVAELRLRNASADLLRALYPEDSMGIICPLLRVLSIEGGPEASDISHPYVNDLAEGRSLRGSPFRKLRINCLFPETEPVDGDRRHQRTRDRSHNNLRRGYSNHKSSLNLSLQSLIDDIFNEDFDEIIEAIAEVEYFKNDEPTEFLPLSWPTQGKLWMGHGI